MLVSLKALYASLVGGAALGVAAIQGSKVQAEPLKTKFEIVDNAAQRLLLAQTPFKLVAYQIDTDSLYTCPPNTDPATSGNWTQLNASASKIFDGRMLYVSEFAGSDAFSGNASYPKKTLAAAFAASQTSACVEAAPGEYLENISLAAAKFNVMMKGTGVGGSPLTLFYGTVTTAGIRLRITDWQLAPQAPTAAPDATCFTATSTNCKHWLENVNFITNGIAITTPATARGWINCTRCDFSEAYGLATGTANIVLPNLTSGGAATLYLTACANARLSIGTGWTVIVGSCPSLQIISNAGTLFFTDTQLGSPYIMGMLSSQAQLTSLLSDTNVATDGYYAVNFASPTVGARGDILLKISVQGVATSVKVHRPLAMAPTVLSTYAGAAVYKKTTTGWSVL